MESKYPNCGILVTDDFNRLDISGLLRHFRLKQIVKVHTRKDATLDLILTNMHEYYSPPQPFAPFGLSDHNVVVATPLQGKCINSTQKTITKRDLRASSQASMGRFLNHMDWPILFAPLEGCEEMWNTFTEAVHTGLDILMPVKQYCVCTADAPWMTQRVKDLILKRQKVSTMHGPESTQFKYFRNVVNRERKACRARYYESKVQQGENTKKWWDEVKRLSGAKSRNGDLVNLINVEQFSTLSGPDQANAINSAFLEPLEVYKLHESLARIPLEDTPKFLTVSEERVQRVLANLNQSKASGPDNVPNWLLKEYSDILAFPITHILNASYREQRLPAIWKMANVPPLPKEKPALDLKNDLRPISLTPCVSKVAEEFVVEDVVKPAVLDMIHGNQYGAIPKSSTTMALISMLYAWSLGTDGNGATVRTMSFDYRKAFDFIDHSILIDKLCKLDISPSVVNWIIDSNALS